MRKVILFLSVFVLGFGLISCDDDPVIPNRAVELDKAELALFLGDKAEVLISQVGEKTEAKVEYSVVVDNKNATAKVMDNKVEITALKIGKAKVTVTDVETQKTASVNVTIKAVPELAVDVDAVKIIETQTKEITITSGSGKYVAKSSSEEHLTAKVENDKVMLTGVKCDESGLNSTEVKVTITDARGKTKEITVNVFKTVDIAKEKLEMTAGQIEGVGFVSGDFEAMKVTSSDEKVATAKIEVAESGLKQVTVTAVAAGECTVEVTDGVATKTISVAVAAVNPVSIWGPDKNGDSVELTEFDLVGNEQYFTIKGGNGEFEFSIDEEKLTSNGFVDGEDILLHIARNNDYKDGGAAMVKVWQKDNPSNFAELKVNIIMPLAFTYVKDGKELTPEKDGDGDDLLRVKLNDVVTLKVTGQTGHYFIQGNSLDSFEFTGLVEKDTETFYGKQKTLPNGIIDIKMIKKGEYYFKIKDYKTTKQKFVTFVIE